MANFNFSGSAFNNIVPFVRKQGKKMFVYLGEGRWMTLTSRRRILNKKRQTKWIQSLEANAESAFQKKLQEDAASQFLLNQDHQKSWFGIIGKVISCFFA